MASLTEQFIIEAEAVHSVVHAIRREALEETIRLLVENVAPEKIFRSTLGLRIDRSSLAKMEIGISTMLAGIADTGSLVVDLSGADHLVSLLPTRHIAILHESNLYATLSEFLMSPAAPLRYTQITGPSKTADIEKILVYGAHGPVRLDIVLIQN
ncbi:MAG TPA: hypothetical protein DHU63_12325 [Candidatus Marinimicrobia bacterium]|nr:hypothetical protein [Candidatus Neomarinimicrobiota bacterium]